MEILDIFMAFRRTYERHKKVLIMSEQLARNAPKSVGTTFVRVTVTEALWPEDMIP